MKRLDLDSSKQYLQLEPAEQQSHDQDQEQDPNQSRSSVAPLTAVWPNGQGTYQDEDQYDEQNCCKHSASYLSIFRLQCSYMS